MSRCRWRRCVCEILSIKVSLTFGTPSSATHGKTLEQGEKGWKGVERNEGWEGRVVCRRTNGSYRSFLVFRLNAKLIAKLRAEMYAAIKRLSHGG